MQYLAFFKGITNRIILLVLLLEIISLSVWGALTYLSSERELLTSNSQNLQASAIRTSINIGKFLDPLEAEVNAISKLLAVSKLDIVEQKSTFQLLMKSRPEIAEVGVAGADNIERFRISQIQAFTDGNLRDLADNPLVQRARVRTDFGAGGRVLGEINFSEYLEPEIDIIFPIKQSGDLIIIKVNLKWLWDVVQAQIVGESGYVYVVSKNLSLIAHRDPSLVLKKLNLTSSNVPRQLFTQSAEINLHRYANFEHEQVAGVAYYDRQLQWWIVVEQPVSEGLAPLQRVINHFILTFLLVTISTMVIMVFLLRRTMRPLLKLEQGIARLAEGHRDVQIEVSGDSELASLTRSFNTMATAQDKHISGLLKTQQHLKEARDKRETSERQVRLLLNSTEEAIYGIDLKGICTFCNPATLRFLGYSTDEEMIGKPIADLIHLTTVDNSVEANLIDRMHQPDQLGSGLHSDTLLLNRNAGEPINIELRSRPVFEKGYLTGAVVSFNDITERYSYQLALKHQAYHDSLTNLPNRKMLHERMDSLLEDSTSPKQFSLLFIDLDRFKEVNDSLGHKTGDNLLKKLGPRLQAILAPEDLLARLGGDEFAVLLVSQTGREAVMSMCRHLIKVINRPFDLKEMQIQVGASIGIAMCPLHAREGSVLMRFADVAMYHAKLNGFDYTVYDTDIDANSPFRLALSGELQRAINEDQLTLYYQPKIDLIEHKIVGFEALVRWNHPQHGLLMPDQFIPLAELGDLINSLTVWVTNRAMVDRQQWHKQGWDFDVAVNVSVRNLQGEGMVESIKNSLNSVSMSSHHLELEITESSIMTDTDKAGATLHLLNDMGIRIAIDDYGTGYSSLAYLKKLPVEYLKIDKSFILEMMDSDNDALIVRSTIELAHNLGLKVIAEGVENHDSLELLRVLGCDMAQGYYISKPMPVSDVIAWCEAWENNERSALG